MTTVEINGLPLGQMIASAYVLMRREKRETNGSVLGEVYKNGNTRYIVQGIQLSQLAERLPGGVSPDEIEEERINSLLPKIGGFHSHTISREVINGRRIMKLGRLNLGATDRNYMRTNYPQGIEIVLVINPTNRLKMTRIDEHSLSGCFEDNNRFYSVELGAYILEHNKKRRALLKVRREDVEDYLV